MSGQPSQKELRQFGLLVGGVFLVISLWSLVFRGAPLRQWALGVGVGLVVCGAVMPQSLKHVFMAWVKAGHVLGAINTRIILGVIYYGLITPMALVMRLMGKDAMHRKLVREATTYRVIRHPRPRYHMRNQF